jgi:mRNA interferase MazF
MNPPDVSRGEVWDINFDPQIGDEIAKIRPAVVLDVGSARLELRIVVPITAWRPEFAGNVSKVRLDPSLESGLTKGVGSRRLPDQEPLRQTVRSEARLACRRDG